MNMILQDQKPQVPRVWKNPSRSVPLFLLATAVYVDECVDVGFLGEVAEWTWVDGFFEKIHVDSIKLNTFLEEPRGGCQFECRELLSTHGHM